MKIRDYIEQAIQLDTIALGGVPLEQAGALVLRWGFPTPVYGAEIIASHRGDTNNGIDYAVYQVKNFTEQLIEGVVEECIRAIQQQPDLDDDARREAIAAIREQFEIVVH